MTKQEKAAAVSIATNVTLTVAKFILASLTASVALLAEAYHSFSDILSSVLVLLAVRVDRRQNSQSAGGKEEQENAHRSKPRLFRPGDWENKVAMGIGCLLLLVAFNIFGKVSQPNPIPVRYPLAAGAFVAVLAAISYLLYRFEISVGTDTKSAALVADGHHAKTDMLASVLVVSALVATKIGIGIDRVAAAVIGLLILLNALHVLTQSVRAYFATAKGKEFEHEIIYEDIVFLLLYRTFTKLEAGFWERVGRVPGFKHSPERLKKRFGLAAGCAVVLAGICAYALSGVYVLQPGEQAIVERFGRPLHRLSPVGPGLHWHLPWPVDQVKKAHVADLRRLTVGYQAGNRQDFILWTNIHYVREYSVITGEGPFLDVAMNIHYRIENLFEYLYSSATPDEIVKTLGYQTLRKTFGTRQFFPSITTDRDVLENLMREELQRSVDEMSLGVTITNVCLRDLHPPAQVAAAFEEVVSAQEDFETFIEQANGYRKDLLPVARGSAATILSEAAAYRHAIVAQSAGKAKSFTLQESAYRAFPEMTEFRLVLETFEEALADVPKYIVRTTRDDRRPDLWLSVPPSVRETVTPNLIQATQGTAPEQRQSRISSEEDLIEAIQRLQGQREGGR
ncbi:MAG: hypothetical protein Kow0099_08020 [Candidatus Abyssubacteria bacterium]